MLAFAIAWNAVSGTIAYVAVTNPELPFTSGSFSFSRFSDS